MIQHLACRGASHNNYTVNGIFYRHEDAVKFLNTHKTTAKVGFISIWNVDINGSELIENVFIWDNR